MEGSKIKKTKGKLPAHIEEKKNKVLLHHDGLSHVSNYETSGVFNSLGVNTDFDLNAFKQNFKINIIEMSDEEIVFDLIGVDTSIANTLRRILIAEIPTMAIEKVYMINNTGVMQDEVLAHRLGLIPIKADPDKFEFKTPKSPPSDLDTIVFSLDVTCKKKANAPEKGNPDDMYINHQVYSGELKWQPKGNQADMFGKDPIKPVHDDILITKLRPGQTLKLQAFCEKGIGQTHAKWSPVSTATYRLMPDITLKKPILNEEAEELVKLCPLRVFDIEDLGNGKKGARVAKPRDCSMCRECIREEKWRDKVQLARIKDHFIFSIESVGVIPAPKLFEKAIKVLLQKCETLEQELLTLSAMGTI